MPLLFVALKVHSAGPLGTLVSECLNSFLRKTADANEDAIRIRSNVAMTRTEIFSKLVERNEERFEIAQGLAVAVITDCKNDVSPKF